MKKLDVQKNKLFRLIKKSDSAKLEEHWSSLLKVKSEINKLAKTLFVSHLRLVIYIAKRYKGYGLDLLDLIQEGSIGLIKATHRWKHRTNTKFSTYATWLIRQKMIRALSQQGNTIRRSRYLEDKIRKIIKTRSKLRVDLEKEPSPEEIAKDMNLPVKKLENIFEKSAIKSISLSTPINGGNSELWMLIEDKKAENPLKNAVKQELNNKVEETLIILTPKERNIIELRFGIGEDTYEHTLKELGFKLHFSRERIRQIEERALRKLRYPLKCFLQDSI
jgi:RNA polymerase primary sigma factor